MPQTKNQRRERAIEIKENAIAGINRSIDRLGGVMTLEYLLWLEGKIFSHEQDIKRTKQNILNNKN